MRLLPPEAFAEVFTPLQGKRVGYIRPHGNVGDLLIEEATFQLFDGFGIDWKIQDPAGPADVEELVFGGGGNMGTLWMPNCNWGFRTRCLQMGPPITILPQSFSSREDRPYHRVYVRERASLRFCEHATLAPDLALGYECNLDIKPKRRLGILLRKDGEGSVRRRWFCRDPAKICKRPRQYLELAARYERIVTDRLHFAICGLIAGRDTTLLPNSYHKNASMHETWLRDLGCNFAESVESALAMGKRRTPRFGRTGRRGKRPARAA
ncbi:MAG: polysaccharide pyruvyl transferase family protein [Planctomycetota bacterium]